MTRLMSMPIFCEKSAVECVQTAPVYDAMRKLTRQQQQQADTSVPEDEDEGDEKIEVKVSQSPPDYAPLLSLWSAVL